MRWFIFIADFYLATLPSLFTLYPLDMAPSSAATLRVLHIDLGAHYSQHALMLLELFDCGGIVVDLC